MSERLKKVFNIEQLVNGRTDIHTPLYMTLKPCSFHWKTGASRGSELVNTKEQMRPLIIKTDFKNYNELAFGVMSTYRISPRRDNVVMLKL